MGLVELSHPSLAKGPVTVEQNKQSRWDLTHETWDGMLSLLWHTTGLCSVYYAAADDQTGSGAWYQCSSNLLCVQSHLRILLNCRFWLVRSLVVPEILHFFLFILFYLFIILKWFLLYFFLLTLSPLITPLLPPPTISNKLPGEDDVTSPGPPVSGNVYWGAKFTRQGILEVCLYFSKGFHFWIDSLNSS